MPRLIDVSRPIHNGLPVWPGDPAVAFALRARRTGDSGSNVGTLSLSLHAGTHVDAFFHYHNAGATIDQLDPAIFVGPCVMLDVGCAPPVDGTRPPTTIDAVQRALTSLGQADDALPPRVLLKTDAWTDSAHFPSDFPGIEPALASWLGERGVVLLGVDVPSVDAMSTEGLPAHLACGAAGITILESLRLHDVTPGAYELIALPLRIVGADGSPVRAMLARP